MAILFPIVPIPEAIQNKSNVKALKKRLDWGEPALTIVDVRNVDAFMASHIMGAITMPLNQLVADARASLEFVRDIYVYGETNEQTAEAASRLRNDGYENIAELVGGFQAWKAAKFPIEGVLSASA
jgi:rhodanese-related sulfurtransferase